MVTASTFAQDNIIILPGPAYPRHTGLIISTLDSSPLGLLNVVNLRTVTVFHPRILKTIYAFLINGTSNDGGPACLKNGCCNNSSAVARCAGSLTSILSKNPCSLEDTFWAFFNLGGIMSLILRIACSGGSLKNGGSPSTISITIMPSDQISTSGPYGRREITSGDIQYGVPTSDFLLGSC